jgi:hypothetical protein
MTADRLQQYASAHGNEFAPDTENPDGRQEGAMRLLCSLAASSVLALLVAAAAPQALAQEPSTATSSDGPECDALERQTDDDDKTINRLVSEVMRLNITRNSAREAARRGASFNQSDVDKFNDTIKQAQAKVHQRRVVDGENAPAVRQPLEDSVDDQIISVHVPDSMAPPAGVEPTTYRLGGGGLNST